MSTEPARPDLALDERARPVYATELYRCAGGHLVPLAARVNPENGWPICPKCGAGPPAMQR